MKQMKLKWNGSAPIGFPAECVDNRHAVPIVFSPGEVKEFSDSNWLSKYSKLPQVMNLLFKGSLGGLEILPNHETALRDLYASDKKIKVPSAEECTQLKIQELEKDAERQSKRKLRNPIKKVSDLGSELFNR
jgi:hypothetical protein